MPRTHNVAKGDVYEDAAAVYMVLRDADCLLCIDQALDNMGDQGFYIGRDQS